MIVASFNACNEAVAKLEAAGFSVCVYALHPSPPVCGSASVELCMEYHGANPGSHFRIQDDAADFDPGADETCGFFVYAYEIADILVRKPKRAVVVTSVRGGCAAKLVAALAARIVKAKVPKKAAAVVGGFSGRALKDKTKTKRLYELFDAKLDRFSVYAIEPIELALRLYYAAG